VRGALRALRLAFAPQAGPWHVSKLAVTDPVGRTSGCQLQRTRRLAAAMRALRRPVTRLLMPFIVVPYGSFPGGTSLMTLVIVVGAASPIIWIKRVRTDLESFFDEIAPQALHPSNRRCGRYARAYQSRALANAACHSHSIGAARPWHLAGISHWREIGLGEYSRKPQRSTNRRGSVR
jgi:hypothetical protein